MVDMPAEKLAALESLEHHSSFIAKHSAKGINSPHAEVRLKSRAAVLVICPFLEWLAEEFEKTDHSIKADTAVFQCAAETLAMCLYQAKAATDDSKLRLHMALSFVMMIMELEKGKDEL